MYYAVGEIRSEHFAFYGSVDDKSHTATYFVRPGTELVVQPQQIVFETQFEFELIRCVPFVAPGIVIGSI